MSKNTIIACLTGFCLILFLGFTYHFFMYHYTVLQVVDILSKNAIFEQMEEQVKTARRVEDAVGSMEYAFYYYPGNSAYQIAGSNCERLLEKLRQNSVRRMAATLNERFPELSEGSSPAAWMETYGNKSRLDALRKDSKWYKYYKDWYDKSP
jgi:hypothetical protein